FLAAAIVLGHDVVGNHAAGFANVQLVRPPGAVKKFVFAHPKLLRLDADVLRHARTGGEKVNEAAGVILVLLPNPRAGGVVAVGGAAALARLNERQRTAARFARL